MPEQPTPTTIDAELAAMRRIVAALQQLDERAQARVIGWLVERYEPDPEPTARDGYWPPAADREDVTRP